MVTPQQDLTTLSSMISSVGAPKLATERDSRFINVQDFSQVRNLIYTHLVNQLTSSVPDRPQRLEPSAEVSHTDA